MTTLSKLTLSSRLTDPLSSALGYHLRRASLAIMADLHDRLEILDLTVVKASVLLVVHQNPGAKLIEVGECLDIKRTNITPIVTELENRGLINRIEDGRSHALSTTQAGVALAKKVANMIDASEEFYFGKLSDHRKKVFENILISVRDRKTST